MALLPDFEYDIFISYRHNDNRTGGITEFVAHLKTELAATIKEPVSVYFDSNANDGLLENHHVDKSLEGKLKCLILIPIISQTYCDPKSFAWQHEFVTFNKLAQADALGRDIKLNNGNVASRILPIKIHDLDAADKSFIESELGGALRGIEFIYREPGVNRPLKLTDKKEDNQNHTDYSNQVNKVANAVKDIITAIRFPEQTKKSSPQYARANPSKPRSKNTLVVAALSVFLMCLTGYFIYSRFIQAGNQSELSKSIAVLPFDNLSGEEDAYFTVGVTEDILTQISKINDLRVMSRFTLKEYDAKGKTVQQIGAELGVSYLLTGSIRKSGNDLRISCQLVQVNPEKETWAENFDKKMDDVFAIQHDVAIQVARNLKSRLSSEEEISISEKPTDNLVAYNYYLKGREEYSKYEPDAMKAAIVHFKEALKVDPHYTLAMAGLADAYSQGALGFVFLPITYVDSAISLGNKAVTLNPNSAEAWKALGLGFAVKGRYDEAIEKYRKAIELNPSYEPALSNLANILAQEKGQFAEAVALQNQVIKNNPLNFRACSIIGGYYMRLEMYDEAERFLKKALEINPRDITAHYNSAFLYSLINQREKANEHIRSLAAIGGDDVSINEMIADVTLNIDPKLAKMYLEKAVRSKEFNPQSNYLVPMGVGYLLWKEGKIDSAKEWLDPILAFHLQQVKEGNVEDGLLMGIASNYSVRGEKKEAMKWLRKLVDRGYSDRSNLMSDFRLGNLHKDPDFIKMTEELEKKLADQRLKVSAQESRRNKY